MTNISTYIEHEKKLTLLMESYSEVTEFMSLSNGGANFMWILFLAFIGWWLTLGVLMLTCNLNPFRERKPSRAVFFAAFQEKIRKTFRSQTLDTFNTLMIGTYRVLRRNTEEPTVFMVLSPNGTMSTAKQLVTLLMHCILIAYHYPASQVDMKGLFTDGSKYTSYNEEWPFYYQIKKQLRSYGVAAVFGFEHLHPQIVRTMQLLVPLMFAPYPESVLILVVDLHNRFTEHQKLSMTPNNLGRIFIQEHLGPYVDRNELLEIINQIGSRCILISPEERIHDVISV